MAGDASPRTCEDQNVPYVFAPSELAIGRACGVSRSIIAASITSNDASDLASPIRQLKAKVERRAIEGAVLKAYELFG